MNLDNNPTVDQLRDMVRKCDDSAGHHALWVHKNGDVEISRVPTKEDPPSFEEAHPDTQLRFETFEAGNEYVGPDAADDNAWMSELFERLTSQWNVAKGKTGVEYVDNL